MTDERIKELRREAAFRKAYGDVDVKYFIEALDLAEQNAEKARKWEGLRELDATHVARRLVEAEQERDTLRRERDALGTALRGLREAVRHMDIACATDDPLGVVQVNACNEADDALRDAEGSDEEAEKQRDALRAAAIKATGSPHLLCVHPAKVKGCDCLGVMFAKALCDVGRSDEEA